MNELTRAELYEMICPTDATYDCNQGNCSSSCDKCKDILNYLLDRYDATVRADYEAECQKIFEDNPLMHFNHEQIMWLKEFVNVRCKQARNDAIDECHKAICDYMYSNNIHLFKISKDESDTPVFPYKVADDIYEQLKEQK